MVLQIEHECLDPWAVLRGSGDVLGKGRFRLRAAMQAPARVGAMFGHQRGFGSSRSNTCLEDRSVAMVSFRALPQPAQVSGKWSMIASGVSVWRSVLPG